MTSSLLPSSTIAAVSTPPGIGGIAVIRLAGPDALEIADRVWKGKQLSRCKSHTAHLGEILDSDGETIDTAVATVFLAPNSFTGENTVEFSCHGSPWIQQQIVSTLVDAGASAAGPGEFTRRAFLNGRIDLAQAEGVADMIAASSKAAKRLAINQMKGRFSKSLNLLRSQMTDLASLLELELDFSEEDVEFADRRKLRSLAIDLLSEIRSLAGSFRTGQALKNGVSVVIAGVPNAGKSSVLNLISGDDKAIVSEIPGTTRDAIEDTCEINGILFRFTDTAGLRISDDPVENIGIQRARQHMKRADIIAFVIDTTRPAIPQIHEIKRHIPPLDGDDIPLVILLNKSDLPPAEPTLSAGDVSSALSPLHGDDSGSDSADSSGVHAVPEENMIRISATTGEGLESLTATLTSLANYGIDTTKQTVVTNARHYESLRAADRALDRFLTALDENLPPDLAAQDLREAIHHLGLITGEITSDTLLHTIFSRFCIGK